MKPGVVIEAASGTPTMYTALDTAISFPSQTYATGSTTRISGIRFLYGGGSTTGIKLKSLSGSGTVVIENCVFESNNYGIEGYVPGSSATLTIRNNTFTTGNHGLWLQDLPSSTVIEYNVFAGCGGAGVALEGGTPIVRYNTMVDCIWGITKVGYITPAPSVTNNLILNCDYDGVGNISGGSYLQYNNCYGNSPNYNAVFGGGTPSPNYAQDPSLCSGAITVHVNSVCAPANNGSGQRIGAKGIGCASGDLTNTTTLSTSTVQDASVLVTSDFRIPSTKTLTIDAGVTLRFDTNDESNLGADGNENELIVVGSIDVNGSSGSPVIFESSQGSPAEGDWYGIRIEDAAVTMDYATVRHAQYGVRVNGRDGGADHITNCTFSTNQIYDIDLENNTTTGLYLDVTTNTLTVAGGTGIHINDNYTSGLVVNGNTLTCSP